MTDQEQQDLLNDAIQKGRKSLAGLGKETGIKFLRVAHEMGFKNTNEIVLMFALYHKTANRDRDGDSIISTHGFKMFLTEMILENIEIE